MRDGSEATSDIAPAQVVKRLLDLGVPRTAAAESSGSFEINYFDLSSLKIRSSRFNPIVYSRKGARSKELIFDDVDDLVRQAETALASPSLKSAERLDDDGFVVLIQSGHLPLEVRPRRSLPKRPNYVILDGSDCLSICDSAQRDDALRVISRACAAAIGPLPLSPYVMGAPAVGYRFFGRQSLLKRVGAKTGASITLIGTRRIGKTSLLNEVKRQLSMRHPDLLVAHLYGSNLDSAYEVLTRIIEDAFHAARVARVQLTYRDEKELANQLRKLIQHGKHRLAVFIDEFDHILDWDSLKDFRLLNLLRELSYNDACSFYFAGFRQTLRAVEDVNNPLYNFTSVERIQPFKRIETFEMVEYPLENLGIPVTVAGLADLIHRESGGQPELIQYMCNKVLEIYSDTKCVITPDELSSSLTSDAKFESTIYRQFTQNLPERQLLAVLLFMQFLGENSDTAKATFTAADLVRGVKAASAHYGADVSPQLARDLAGDLEIAGVITRTGDRAPITYRFTVPRLGDYYMVKGLDNEIRRLVKSEG